MRHGLFYRQSDTRRFARMVLNTVPAARATLRGDEAHHDLLGQVDFYPVFGGTLVVAEIHGLPSTETGIFAMHLHEGSSCTGNAQDPFADTGGHYNPRQLPHPRHAGDMPPLFRAGGFAYSSFFTNRFTPKEAVGHTVVIHAEPDDFHTQPSGASGAKIACGTVFAL